MYLLLSYRGLEIWEGANVVVCSNVEACLVTSIDGAQHESLALSPKALRSLEKMCVLQWIGEATIRV